MLPSTHNSIPFVTYRLQNSANFVHATILCHSVFSCLLPEASFQKSVVAKEKLATGVPEGVYRTSGSFPALPTNITLLTYLIMHTPFSVFIQTPTLSIAV